jgi:hypothetical protein
VGAGIHTAEERVRASSLVARARLAALVAARFFAG